jgi:hypothetical protein
MTAKTKPPTIVRITYLRMGFRHHPEKHESERFESFADGSGSTQLRLDHLPVWLEQSPGAMITSIKLL